MATYITVNVVESNLLKRNRQQADFNRFEALEQIERQRLAEKIKLAQPKERRVAHPLRRPKKEELAAFVGIEGFYMIISNGDPQFPNDRYRVSINSLTVSNDLQFTQQPYAKKCDAYGFSNQAITRTAFLNSSQHSIVVSKVIQISGQLSVFGPASGVGYISTWQDAYGNQGGPGQTFFKIPKYIKFTKKFSMLLENRGINPPSGAPGSRLIILSGKLNSSTVYSTVLWPIDNGASVYFPEFYLNKNDNSYLIQ